MFTVVKLIFKSKDTNNKEQLLFMEHFEGDAIVSQNSFIEDVIKSNLYRKIMPSSQTEKEKTVDIFENIMSTINKSKPIEMSYSINDITFVLLIEYKDSRFFQYFIFNDALILPRNKQYHFVCPSCGIDFDKEILIDGKSIDVEYDLVRGSCICKSCGHTGAIESFIRQYSVCEYFVQNHLN